MAGNALYDVGLRLRAAELYDMGRGRASIAALLGIPEETVRKWLDVYRSAGIEVLAMMGKKHTAYSLETKLAAVRAVADEGMTKYGITSPSSLKKWLKARDCHDALSACLLASWSSEQLEYMHDMSWWRNMIGQTSGVVIEDMHQMTCTSEAWADWIACDNEYAQGDRAAVEAGALEYLNTIAVTLVKD